MSLPGSTAEKHLKWRLWHAYTAFMAGGCFLVASMMLFPLFDRYVEAVEIASWTFTIGSFVWVLADTTLWLHFVTPDCRHRNFAINYFLNIVSSALFLAASVCLIPEVGRLGKAISFVQIAAIFLLIAQIWKMLRIFRKKDKTSR
jgi:hypothetical protein